MNYRTINFSVGRRLWIASLFFLGIVLSSLRVWATPPESLMLEYDRAAEVLTISGSHPTQDRLEHFIRRAVVVRNQDEAKKFYVTRQDSASGFKFKVPFKAEPGDQLQVEVFCSQGGSKSAVLMIPKIVQEAEPKEFTAEDLKAIKDRDHQSIPVIP